jgi:hypothetical protein
LRSLAERLRCRPTSSTCAGMARCPIAGLPTTPAGSVSPTRIPACSRALVQMGGRA